MALAEADVEQVSLSGFRPAPGMLRRARAAAVWKRTFDITVATVLLVLLLPVMVTLCLLVSLDGGPALFGHHRLGRGGRTFAMLKFRSMHPDAEARLRSDPVLWQRYVANGCKLPAGADPRITRLGAFLRRTSLDELPQLVNVIRGDMSLVGPRPIIAQELDEYRTRGAAEAYLERRPGITGAWQAGGRSNVGYGGRVEMDLSYHRSASPLTDLRILVRTVPAVIRRSGAH